MQLPPPPGSRSPDGRWVWNGAQWMPVASGPTAGGAFKSGFFGIFGAWTAACAVGCVILVVVVLVVFGSCAAVNHQLQNGLPTPIDVPQRTP